MKLIANNIHKKIRVRQYSMTSVWKWKQEIYMDFGVEMDLEKPCCFGHYRV